MDRARSRRRRRKRCPSRSGGPRPALSARLRTPGWRGEGRRRARRPSGGLNDQPRRDASKALERLDIMLNLGRSREAMADELAPFLEIGRLAEIDRVVFQGLPSHEQAVAARLLLRALQLPAPASLRALEQRDRSPDPRFELRFRAGFDVELCDLQNHSDLPFRYEPKRSRTRRPRT